MHLSIVKCSTVHTPEEDEHQLAFVIANTAPDAEQICRDASSSDKGYAFFQTIDKLDGWAGPARVLGWEGEPWER